MLKLQLRSFKLLKTYLNPFVPMHLLYLLKTSENLTVSCFQEAEKGCTGNEWVNKTAKLRENISVAISHNNTMNHITIQKQPSRVVLKKRCSENMQQIYRKTPMRNVISINFIDITIRHGCFPVNLLQMFRKPFPTKISGRLRLPLILFIFSLTFSGEFFLKQEILVT